MDTQNISERILSPKEFSETFLNRCRQMNLLTLGDILAMAPAQLMEHEYFTYSWLAELSAFLSKENKIHLLQPMPGSIPG